MHTLHSSFKETSSYVAPYKVGQPGSDFPLKRGHCLHCGVGDSGTCPELMAESLQSVHYISICCSIISPNRGRAFIHSGSQILRQKLVVLDLYKKSRRRFIHFQSHSPHYHPCYERLLSSFFAQSRGVPQLYGS